MLAETIFRETRAEVAHNRIARDFRDDARSRDGEAEAIAVDDGGLGQGKRKHWQAVDENVLWLNGETGDGSSHRLVGRAQNINRVDLDRVDDSDGPPNGVVRDEIAENFFAFFREQLFGIVQLPVPKFLRKNDGGGYDWARQGATSRFVNPGNGGDSKGAEFALMPEPTATVHRAKILKRGKTKTLKLFQLFCVSAFIP